MKKFIHLLFTLSLFHFQGTAQPVDSASIERIMEKRNTQIAAIVTSQAKEIKDSVSFLLIKNSKAILKPNIAIANFITLLPTIMFSLIIIIVAIKLRRDNVKLSDFLIDKEAQISLKKEQTKVAEAKSNATIAAANAIRANSSAYVAANVAPPEIPLPPMNSDSNIQTDTTKEQSTSRLIAFISGLTSVGIAVCIATFYFYKSFLGESNLNIGNLSNILYGLGLGVIPYGFNKVASALK